VHLGCNGVLQKMASDEIPGLKHHLRLPEIALRDARVEREL